MSTALNESPPAPNRPPGDHRTSYSRMDGATGHRGLSERHRATVAAAGSRCHLRGRVPAPCRRHGHHGGHHQSLKSLAKSVCGETDRIPPARVSQPRDRPRRPASPPSAGRVSNLLSWRPNASRLREGRADDVTRPDADRRARGRVPGSGRITPSLRTTRSMTGPIDRRPDVDVCPGVYVSGCAPASHIASQAIVFNTSSARKASATSPKVLATDS